MNKIKKKLTSEQGASISFALLLFLVCAVISSIVITAGSAASGRMSNLAVMDRRYYAVTSAAELLVNEINGGSVNVDLSKTTGEAQSSGEESILSDASEKLVEALASGKSDPSDVILTRKLRLSPETVIENAALDCMLIEKLRADGMLFFDVMSGDGESSKGAYTLRVVFSSNVKESATDSRSDTKRTAITWKLHSIRKL